MIGADTRRPAEAADRRATMLLTGLSGSDGIARGGFSTGAGCRLFDSARNEYVDCALRGGALVGGHAHPAVVEALAAHLAAGESDRRELAALERHRAYIHSVMPWTERLLYAADENAAFETAISLARSATGRQAVQQVNLSASGARGRHAVGAVDEAIASDEVAIAEAFDRDDTPSAIVLRCASVDHACGAAPAIRRLRDRCSRDGIVLVYDDRATGFRILRGGLAEACGVTPDLCVLGAITGGGLPLAAVAGSAGVIAAARQRPSPGAMANTGRESANSLAAVAGRATLELLDAPGARAQLHETGRAILQSAERALVSMPVPARLCGDPARFRLVFDGESGPLGRLLMRRFEDVIEAHGVIQNAGHIHVSLAHDAEAIADTVAALANAIESVAQLAERLVVSEGIGC